MFRTRVKLFGRCSALSILNATSNLFSAQSIRSTTQHACRTSDRRWESMQHANGPKKVTLVAGPMKSRWTKRRKSEWTRFGLSYHWTEQRKNKTKTKRHRSSIRAHPTPFLHKPARHLWFCPDFSTACAVERVLMNGTFPQYVV